MPFFIFSQHAQVTRSCGCAENFDLCATQGAEYSHAQQRVIVCLFVFKVLPCPPVLFNIMLPSHTCFPKCVLFPLKLRNLTCEKIAWTRCAGCDQVVGTKCEDGHDLTPFRVTFSTEDAESSPGTSSSIPAGNGMGTSTKHQAKTSGEAARDGMSVDRRSNAGGGGTAVAGTENALGARRQVNSLSNTEVAGTSLEPPTMMDVCPDTSAADPTVAPTGEVVLLSPGHGKPTDEGGADDGVVPMVLASPRVVDVAAAPEEGPSDPLRARAGGGAAGVNPVS